MDQVIAINCYLALLMGQGNVAPANAILTEDNQPILTEAGDYIQTES